MDVAQDDGAEGLLQRLVGCAQPHPRLAVSLETFERPGSAEVVDYARRRRKGFWIGEPHARDVIVA